MSETSREMPVTQVWINTPVSNLDIDHDVAESICDALLKIDGIKEIQRYDSYMVLADIDGKNDAGALLNLGRIRRDIENVFREYGVWPEGPADAAADARSRRETALTRAREAFWVSFASSYPEVMTGDFPPDAHAAFSSSTESAVDTWLDCNLPIAEKTLPFKH